MNKIFLSLVILLSLPALAQINPSGKILSCEWKVDQTETFLIVLQNRPLSKQLSNFSEDRMIGPGGRYIESYNSRPSLELNPAQCLLRIKNSQFSMPSHRLNYELKIEQNEFRVTELSGFGPNLDGQNFICEFSNQEVISKLKDLCSMHASVDGFISMDNEFRIDSEFIADHSLQKEVESDSTISLRGSGASSQ